MTRSQRKANLAHKDGTMPQFSASLQKHVMLRLKPVCISTLDERKVYFLFVLFVGNRFSKAKAFQQNKQKERWRAVYIKTAVLNLLWACSPGAVIKLPHPCCLYLSQLGIRHSIGHYTSYPLLRCFAPPN